MCSLVAIIRSRGWHLSRSEFGFGLRNSFVVTHSSLVIFASAYSGYSMVKNSDLVCSNRGRLSVLSNLRSKLFQFRFGDVTPEYLREVLHMITTPNLFPGPDYSRCHIIGA
jgi:hypothetical protein